MRELSRIVGVIPDETVGRKRRRLFDALRDRGTVVETVHASPPGWVDWAAKAAAFSPRGMHRWKERWEYSPVTRASRSFLGGRRARAVDRAPDALLQIGAYYDLTRVRGLKPGLRCSYHDANLAVFARDYAFVADVNAPHIRRTLAAEQRVFDGLGLIFAMSDWLRRSFIEDFGQDPDKVVTVGGGANIPHVPEVPVRDWERPRLLFIGLEWDRKGGSDLLEAFAKLHAERPDAELRIVGRERPAGGEPQPGVHWLGRIDRTRPEGEAEIERLHLEATAYVMPSVFEPFANVFLEAMAWGLPCVGSDRCSIPETVEHGVTGYTAPARNPDALASVLLELVSDPARARRMGEAGRQRFLERYTWDSVAARMISEIESRL